MRNYFLSYGKHKNFSSSLCPQLKEYKYLNRLSCLSHTVFLYYYCNIVTVAKYFCKMYV